MDRLTLFTKDRCVYCHMLQEKLDMWNIEYVILNNHPLPDGHTTYPQLYYRDTDVQKGASLYYRDTDVQKGASTDVTEAVLLERMERVMWPGMDGGIEDVR